MLPWQRVRVWEQSEKENEKVKGRSQLVNPWTTWSLCVSGHYGSILFLLFATVWTVK